MFAARTKRILRAAVACGLLVAGWIACAPRLEDMTPFPCANDGTCPLGLSCTPGVGCVRASLDSPCGPSTDCSGAGATCTLGLCTIGCDEKRPCAPGHVCSAPASAGTGVCTPDCTAAAPCPPGLSCRPLYGEAKGCIGTNEKSTLDGPCEVTEDCASGASSVTCSFGACTTGCNPTRPCDAGHICSAYKTGDGACLVDCTSSNACPQGLECRPIGREGKKACVGAGKEVTPCSVDLATDARNCGACANECGALQTCVEGACSCPKTTCGTSCVDPQIDPANCGACGHTCFGGTCNAGKCEIATVISTPGEAVIGADAHVAYTAASPGAMATGTLTISRIALAGGARSSVYSATSIRPSNIYFDGTAFYWTEWTDSTNTVRKINVVTTSGVRSGVAWPNRAQWLADDGCGAGSRVVFGSPNAVAFTAKDTMYTQYPAVWLSGSGNPWTAQLNVTSLYPPPNPQCGCNFRDPPQCTGNPPIGLVAGAYHETNSPAAGMFAYRDGGDLWVLKLPQPNHPSGCQAGCGPFFLPTRLIAGDTTLGAPIDVDGDSIYTHATDGKLERITISPVTRTPLATISGIALPDASHVYVLGSASIRRVAKTGGAIQDLTLAYRGAQVTSVGAGPTAVVWIDGGVLKLVAK